MSTDTTIIVLLDPGADVRSIRAELLRRGAETTALSGASARALLVEPAVDATDIPGVAHVLAAPSPHPLVDAAPSVVEVGGVAIGGAQPVLMAGPCAVEDEAQIDTIAAAVASAGGRFLRGGAFKPRTSPYSFCGLGVPGLRLMREAARAHGLAVVTEVMEAQQAEVVAEHADLLQVGSRTMAAFALLRAVGATGKPVLLKRGMAATVEEWLLAAEHLLEAGASGVILCERGIRTFAQPTRNTLDLGSVAWLLAHRRLPVIVDPSHGAGRRELVLPLARAALAVGAHGIMVECHHDAAAARSDALQAIGPEALRQLGREMAAPLLPAGGAA